MVQPVIFCTSRVCRFVFFNTKDMLVLLINRFIKSIAGRIEQNNNMFFYERSEVFGKKFPVLVANIHPKWTTLFLKC